MMTAGVAAMIAVTMMGALASTAFAQPALPFKAYGTGLTAGQVVAAMKGTTEVARATVDASGNWQMDIPADKANAGDRITFTLNGQPTSQSITFQNGQFVPPPGLALTVSAGGTATPGPAPTGNAGLHGNASSTSLALVMALAAVAIVGSIGARSVIRQR